MPNAIPSLASSITKLGMVRFAIARHVSFSGRDGWASGKVELPAFMHDAPVRPAPLAPLPPLPSRREVVAPSNSGLAAHAKPSGAASPRVRSPSMLGMPWRWL